MVVAVVVLQSQVEVDAKDVGVGGDEVGVDLLLLVVFEDLLNEPLEILS